MDLGFKENLFGLSQNKTVNLDNYEVDKQNNVTISLNDGNTFTIPKEYFGKIIGTINLPYKRSADWTTCKNALDFLQEKMSYIRKTITSWDVLNLQDTITTPANAVEKIENLLPNSSLMVVFDDANQSFNYNGQDYKTGDMFVKAFDGTIIPIKGAVEKGKYTPTGLTVENNTVTISYGWNTDNKNSVDLKLTEFSPIQPTAYSIKETIDSSSSSSSSSSLVVKLKYPSSLEKGIIPIIKFYYSNELIESDEIAIKKNNEQYTIINNLPFSINVEVK